MQGRESQAPVKSQLTQIVFNGRTYTICSEGQMNYIMAVGMQEIQNKAAAQGKNLSEEEVKKELDDYKENCGYAVLTELLAKVSPEERARWQTNYRFAGIVRRSGE